MLPFFAANNGKLSDEELEESAIQAAIAAAGAAIEGVGEDSLSRMTAEQFQTIIEDASHAYMTVYVDYVPF